MTYLKLILFLFLGLLFLLSCTEKIPRLPKTEKISKERIPLYLVQQFPQSYKGQEILWGGKIMSCSNKENSTIFEILEFALDKEGNFKEEMVSEGRFIVETSDFLDCAIYSSGKFITIKGVVEGIREGKIEERSYKFPVIKALEIKLVGTNPQEVSSKKKYLLEEKCSGWHPWSYPCWEKSW